MGRKHLLLLILFLAAVLRLWNLGSGDVIGDEGLLAFRAIGLLDFDKAEFQTTPLEWFDPDVPSWTKLSFHDHPPLVFLIQHIFIRFFGESNFAFRLPSALLGIASVYLLYLIGAALYSKRTGLLGAAFLAVAVNQIFISRVGLQESHVIFFLLLAVYFFLKALRKDKFFIWTGAAIGLGLLTKYTTFVLIPIFLTYLLVFRRECFKNKRLWLGALLAVLIFSPVIIYNLKLYQATGHFDFQFSYVFGQDPEVWKTAPGKEEIGTMMNRIRDFIPNLTASNSWAFLLIFTLTIATFVFYFFKRGKNALRENSFLLIIFFYLILLLLLIGPTFRFLTMLIPFAVLSVAAVYSNVLKNIRINYNKFAVYAGLAVILIFETGYSINSQIIFYPKGPETLAFSKLRYENYNWGYSELDEFLKKELQGKMPALTFDMRYQFLEDAREMALKEARAWGLESYSALIIYDGNFYNIPQLWILDRLQIYHGWPVIDAETYVNYLQEQGPDYFRKAGIKNYYFIMPTDKVPLKRPERLTLHGGILEQELLSRGLQPINIYNKRNETVFRIYQF